MSDYNPCDSYCEHGGVCVLDQGHEGLHTSDYCEWDDAHALTREAADAVLAANHPYGATIAALEGTLRDIIGSKP